MQVEIWSDVLCPWCYIGKRHFEEALAQFAHRDEVDVTWRSFELDPSAPRHREGSQVEHIARKYGITVEQAQAAQDRITRVAARADLAYDFDRIQPGNSFDAHRLIHLAADHGLQDEMKERLMAAYLTEGAAIGEPETLEKLGVDIGLDPQDVRAVLDSDRYRQEVRADEAAASTLGISAVPFFVFDRTYGVSGAQPAEALLEVLEKAWAETHPLTMLGGTGEGVCEGDDCPV
jgi:predicted DsbA family dithiol-disulfide isomerase